MDNNQRHDDIGRGRPRKRVLRPQPRAQEPALEQAQRHGSVEQADPETDQAVEAIRARRRKNSQFGIHGFKLNVPTGLDRARYVYRWVNDNPGRIAQMTAPGTYGGDWERVKSTPEMRGDSRNATEAEVISRVVDKSEGTRAVLLRKLKALYQDDFKVRQERNIDTRRRTQRQGVAGAQPEVEGNEYYDPKEVKI